MNGKTWRFSQRAAVTAVSLLLGTVAQAGNIRGELKPDAANGIPAYNGFAIFNVPSSCLFASAGWHSTACGTINMESATIYLYDVGNPNGVDPGPIGPGAEETLTFDSLAFQDPDNIQGILVDGIGHVLGLDSSRFNPGVASNNATPYQTFGLQFVTGCLDDAELILGDPVCSPFTLLIDTLAAPNTVITVADPQGILSDNESNGVNQSRTGPGQLQFTPEPGTVSLILGALGGGWLARRRRKKAAA